MYVLALDTTTRDGSVALVDDHGIIEERRGDAARSHAERLPDELIGVAAAHGVPIGAIDVFAVAAGPGSFTGLRIGIATIQGLALTVGKRIVAVSALDALAQCTSGEPGTYVAAWMDARRRDVFAALYRVTDGPPFSPERLVEVEGAVVGDPATWLVRWERRLGKENMTFVGDGAALYANDISRLASPEWTIATEIPLLAGAIGLMAVARAQRGDTLDPAAIQPLYVRRPDAEVERERQSLEKHG